MFCRSLVVPYSLLIAALDKQSDSKSFLITKTNTHTQNHKLNTSTQKLTRLSCKSYIAHISCPLFWWLNWLAKGKKNPSMHQIFAVPVQGIVLSSGYSTSWECNSVGDQEGITGTWTTWITTLMEHWIYILKKEQRVFFRSSFLIKMLNLSTFTAYFLGRFILLKILFYTWNRRDK